MSDKKFQRFGKYLILDHLVDGGMAKICRARYLGEQANKMVAVKMVQPQFSNDDAFVRMFQDELNITFGMLHPNIMQVYDYGKTNGQLYTAMEYIHGANLKQYLDRLKERKVVFPVEISCYIISQVCLGLHYAHTFTDKLTGKPYNIIHRDISPHNIMLTYDGAVKVIDFGIAKANTNSEATQAGTIKGKLSYLAPEYLDGMELDARYDEFAVGITLWEMLCSRKLFHANNDLAVLKLIQACKIVPPSQINPSVPKELDTIVMKALSKDRNDRYENLDQMNRALVRFLYSHYPEFNASDLATFADDLFKSEIVKDREKFVEYGKIDIQSYIEEMKKEESKTGRISKKDAGLQLGLEKKVREIELSPEATNGHLEIDGTRKLNKTTLQAAKASSKNAKVNSTGSAVKKADKTSSYTHRKELEKLRESSSSGPRHIVMLIIAASIAFVAYFQSERVEKIIGFNLKKMIHGNDNGRSISSEESMKRTHHMSQIVKESDLVDETMGSIVLGGVDISMDVYLNGKKTDYVGALKVPLNEEATIIVKKSGYMPFTTKLTLNKEKNSTVINVPTMEKSRLGSLSSTLNYAPGSKLVYFENGQEVIRDLPIKGVPISEGTYQAKIINPLLNTEKKVEFTIIEYREEFLK